MTTELVNANEGVQLRLDGGWREVDAAGAVLAAVSGDDTGSGFRPSVVVTVSAIGDLDLESWAAGTRSLLADSLQEMLLLDQEDVGLAGRAGIRHLLSYLDDRGTELTLCQWMTTEAQRGLALSLTCATEDFPELRSVGEQAAAVLTWEVTQ